LLQILRKIGLRERDNAIVMRLRTAHHALAPPVPNGRLDRFDAGTVETVERAGRQVVIELGPVAEELRLQIVEHGFGQAQWIGRLVGRQRPTVAEHDGLSFAPGFVVDVDVSSVLFCYSYIWHDVFSFWLVFSLGGMLMQATRDKQRFASDPF